MTPTYHYNTVIEALKELNNKGYNFDFNLHEEEIKNNPSHYTIEHIYRYEGDTDPSEEAVVYGIKSNSGVMGVFVAGFSANSDNDVALVLINLSSKARNEHIKS